MEEIKNSDNAPQEESKSEVVQVTPQAPAPMASKPAWMSFVLPASIILAAIMISGSVLYSKIGSGTAQIGQAADSQLSVENLKKWAKSLKLDTKSFDQCFADSQYKNAIDSDIAYGAKEGVTGTPSFFINGEALVGAQPFTEFASAIDKALASKKAPTKTLTIDADDYILGNTNAPVTMVEFSDFQCPFCRRFFQETLSQIKTQYVDTGKVKLVFKQFPLTSIHPMAEPAAEAAECAGAQGKFWEMHDLIFSKQS